MSEFPWPPSNEPGPRVKTSLLSLHDQQGHDERDIY
jgi:hypothetical protein